MRAFKGFYMLVKVLFTVLLFSIPNPVLAYIDPGTGSVIIQALIAGIATMAYAFHFYWAKLKSFIFKEKNNTPNLKHEKDEMD